MLYILLAFFYSSLITINLGLVENPTNENTEDFVCDFEDRRIAETVRFQRSPYSCRVYHVCAFYKQYTLTCAEGLFFDEYLDSCNFENLVECPFNERKDNISLVNNITESLNLISTTKLAVNESKSTDSLETLVEASTVTNNVDFLMSTEYISENTTKKLTTEFTSTPISVVLSSHEINETAISNNIPYNSTEFFKENSTLGYQTQTNSSFNYESIITNSTQTTTSIKEDFTQNFKSSTIPSISIPLYFQENSNINDSWWLGPINCIAGFDHKISNKDNCALYYECTKSGEKIEKACPYPLQYDEMLNECRSYEFVDCGSRKQAKDLCDYKLLNSQSEMSCEMYPSCKNLSDGLYPSNDCRHYYQCKDERTLRIFSCPKNKKTGIQLKFNFLTKRCDDIENVSFNCGGYSIPIDLYTNKMVCPSHNSFNSEDEPSMETRDLFFSHPKDCNIYIGCDQNGNMSILECLNGTHFSPYYQSCVHPSVANCKKYHTMDETLINYSLRLLLLEKNKKSGLLNDIKSSNLENSNPILNSTKPNLD